MKIIELIIDEEQELFGIDAISLVENPAILSNWLALNENKTTFAQANEEKRILIGPALIPDKPIVENKEMDKSALYNLDVPVGTWMVSMKIENDAIWDEWVKSKRVKGFSIEGFFIDKIESENRAKMTEELTEILAEAVSNNVKFK